MTLGSIDVSPTEGARKDCSSAVRYKRRIVASRLCGGLGNQLFQFAAGRALAHRCDADLVLDASVFTLPGERRKFALGQYPIHAKVIDEGYAHPPISPVVTLPRSGRQERLVPGLLYRIAHRIGATDGMANSAILAVVGGLRALIGRSPGLRVFTEKTFDYDPSFTALGSDTYLDGYWQSYRYFSDIAQLLRRELTLPCAASSANERWLARIQSSNSVCVHVRRGDYLVGAHFAQHGLCSPDYYARAMRLVAARSDNPQFFVFSDDLDWCRQHLVGPNVAFVDANAADAAHDELRLMAACGHHVIANSSLSWWGAWLAHCADQIVIGPDPWFATCKPTPDLFPPSWIAIPRD